MKASDPYRAVLATYLGPQWPRVVLLGVFLAGGLALQLVSPLYVRSYIDTARNGGSLQTLTVAALLYLGTAVLAQAVLVLETYVAEDVGWIATNRLRADLALHCLRLDLAFHAAHTPGALIERIDGDVANLANFLSRFVTRILGNALLVVGVLVVLFTIDERVGLLFALLTILALVTVVRLRALPIPFWKAERQASADLYGFLEERLAGVEDIRANGAVDYTLRRFFDVLGALARVARQANVLGVVTISAFFGFWGLANGITFGLGALLVPSVVLTLGTLYLIYSYILTILLPLNALTEQFRDLQQASASIARVVDLMAQSSRVKDDGQEALPHGPPAVAFARVSFAYGEGPPVLQDVSFRLEAGKILGLVGRTGSGKTTITRLIFRFADPVEGRILLGGHDLRALRLADLRARIGLVTQDVQVFGASLRDNLTLFDPTIGDDRLQDVLTQLGLVEWYRNLPAGLDCRLGSGGIGPSAGEAQLIALARVFLRDPGQVILDEPTSRLDPATERLVDTAVARLLAGRTAILVAHRLETLHRADDILVLEAGRVVEHGPRADLVADPDSHFARLLCTGREEVLA